MSHDLSDFEGQTWSTFSKYLESNRTSSNRDMRDFKGQTWSNFSKYLESNRPSSNQNRDFDGQSPDYSNRTIKDSGPRKPTDGPPVKSNSVCLDKEDFFLYGKYPGAEPLILVSCGYCGSHLKITAMAHHLAKKHEDCKAVVNTPEKGNNKINSKASPTNILKKSQLKSIKPNNVIKSKESCLNKESSNNKEALNIKDSFNNKVATNNEESLNNKILNTKDPFGSKATLVIKEPFNSKASMNNKELINNKVHVTNKETLNTKSLNHKKTMNNKDSLNKGSLNSKDPINSHSLAIKDSLNCKESYNNREDLPSPIRGDKVSRVINERKRINYNHSSANKDIFVVRSTSDVQGDLKSSIDSTKMTHSKSKVDPPRLKKTKDEKGFSVAKHAPSKLHVNGSADLAHCHLPRSKDKVFDSSKKNGFSQEQERPGNTKFKFQDGILPKGSISHPENGVSDDLSDGSIIEIKRRKIGPKSITFNPDHHHGVIEKENSKPCTSALPCSPHTMSLRRAVRGRGKHFNQLLGNHGGEKAISKHKINETSNGNNILPDVIDQFQLTPVTIPLVLNPLLTQVDPIMDGISCSLLPGKNMNEVRLNCNVNSDIIHSMNNIEHFQPNSIKRKKLKKRKKKRKLTCVKKSQVKPFSLWHPWYRKIGGLLYTQNNLPNFANLRNVKKKMKQQTRATHSEKKENIKYSLHPVIPEGSYQLMKSIIEE